LENNFFEEMIENGEDVRREKKLGNSRIDFQIKNNFIEVKTFVGNIPYGSREPAIEGQKSLDRLIKHFTDLAQFAREQKGKAIVLICNQYNAEKFTPPKNSEGSEISETVKKAIGDGVEN
jgi:sugar fermentation stimulation protein A